MLKITDTGAKVCGNGPHEMIRCIENFTEFKFDRISCFQVENRMIGAIYTRTPIRSVWHPCGQTRTNKRIQVSKRKSGIMTNFHVLHSSSIIFSLYIFLCNRADLMQIDGMSQLRHTCPSSHLCGYYLHIVSSRIWLTRISRFLWP